MAWAWGRVLARTVVAIFVIGAAHGAVAADWTVAQMTGQVTIAVAGAQTVALRRDAVLPSGGILRTGASSRALLVRNAETITVGANAAIAVPPGSNNGQFTTVLQNAGVVAFSVDKQNVQHFSVETPYLAAVVKGTEFSVEVAPDGATVRVTRGVVEVTALRTGYVTSVTAGQAVQVRADGLMAFAGVPQPQVIQGAPRAPLVGSTLASLQQALPLNLGIGSTTGASLRAGPVTVGVDIGDGITVDGGVGSFNLGLSAGGDSGLQVTAGPASLSAGPGGLDVDAGIVTASAGSSGLEVTAGPAAVSVGTGGVQVDLGPLHLGLGH